MNPEDPYSKAPADKVWWKSKVVWLNILALASLAVPAVAQWVKNNPVEPMVALAALNTLVRFVTSGKVTLFSDDEGSSSGNASSGGPGPFGGSSGGARDSGVSGFIPSRGLSLIWLVGAACAVALFQRRTGVSALLMACAAMLLPSCTRDQLAAFREVPITIGIEGEHGTYGYSSKGGLSVSVKTPRVRQEKSAVDYGKIIAREWEDGRFAEPVIPPDRSYRPRRLVLP